MRKSLFFVGCLILTTGIAAAQSVLSPPYQLPDRYSYAAKFVCGSSTAVAFNSPAEPAVKRGNYATVINIHNPWQIEVAIVKKVALAAPERFPNTKFIPPTKRYREFLLSDFAMSVNCEEIVNLLVQNGTPPGGSFIEGFLVIDSFFAGGVASTAAALDVVTVTTSEALPNGAAGLFGNPNHEVTTVPGKLLQAGLWPY